jgi:hypothetical protein
MTERVLTEVALQLLSRHPAACECFRCRSLRDLLDARARAKELETALREVMAWGVEHDDPRMDYITVQVDRVTIAAARAAAKEAE